MFVCVSVCKLYVIRISCIHKGYLTLQTKLVLKIIDQYGQFIIKDSLTRPFHFLNG